MDHFKQEKKNKKKKIAETQRFTFSFSHEQKNILPQYQFVLKDKKGKRKKREGLVKHLFFGNKNPNYGISLFMIEQKNVPSK